MRHTVCLMFLGCVGLLPGCDGAPRSDYDAVELVGVHGAVNLDGQPLADAVITFESADGQFSYGMTDAQGRYALQFDSVQAGATPGPKTVRISTTRKIVGLNGEDDGGEEAPGESDETPDALSAPVEERVPPKYNRDSELRVEVTPGQTEYNFELASP